MIIGVSGATSGIGRAVLETIEGQGHSAIQLVRRPQSPSDRRYDLQQPLDIDLLAGLDALIHLAWDWDAKGDPLWDVNARAGRSIAGACQELGVRPILLSTYSVFAAGPSRYGTSKLVVEREFIAVGGSALRAGLIWGGDTAAGVVQTLARISNLPALCPHFLPDPSMHHSEQTHLAQGLVAAATHPDSDRSLLLAASPEPIKLAEITHALERGQRKLHVAIPSSWVVAAATAAETAGIPLPFRTDSIRAVSFDTQFDAYRSSMSFSGDFPGRAAFLSWLQRLAGESAAAKN